MAANPSAASTLAMDEPTIRFATEAGVYHFASIHGCHGRVRWARYAYDQPIFS